MFGNCQLTVLRWSLGGRNVVPPEQTQEHAAVGWRSQRWVLHQMCRPPRRKQTDCDHHMKKESFSVPQFENHPTSFTSPLHHLRNSAAWTEANVWHKKKETPTLNSNSKSKRDYSYTYCMEYIIIRHTHWHKQITRLTFKVCFISYMF